MDGKMQASVMGVGAWDTQKKANADGESFVVPSGSEYDKNSQLRALRQEKQQMVDEYKEIKTKLAEQSKSSAVGV